MIRCGPREKSQVSGQLLISTLPSEVASLVRRLPGIYVDAQEHGGERRKR
jgi:hypothetical protein